ncbi:hypothetical protein BH23ACT9_BH23ACT9_18190 [soil metagenome]
MTAQHMTVAVRPGAGIVARTGNALLVVLPGGSDVIQDELLDAFTAACEGKDAPGRGLARKLVGLLSQADPDDVPSFGACAPNDRGWAVILHQGVALRVDHGDVATSLSGFDASTWVDRIVEDGFTSLTLMAEGEEVGPVDTRFRLDGGVIPGAGATLLPDGAAPSRDVSVPAPAPAPAVQEPAAPTAVESPTDDAAMDPPAAAPAEPAADPVPLPERPVPPAAPQMAPPVPTPTPNPTQQGAVESTAVPADGGFFAQQAGEGGSSNGMVDEDEPPTLIQSSSDRPEEMPADAPPQPEDLPAEDVPFESFPLLDIGEEALRDPLPVLTAETPKEEIEDESAPMVYGVLSPAGYFNHPDALFCSVTGVSMLHRTHVLVQRPRPPLGVVVADDGSTFTLNSNYVVGREPEREPQVEANEARPLKLQDAERSLSRVHAEIRLIDWDVYIVDRGSANGTYVLPRGGQQWKRLVADTPEKVVPGTRVAFGKRVMTYESHHQINQQAAS